jgi:hypothetical protein
MNRFMHNIIFQVAWIFHAFRVIRRKMFLRKMVRLRLCFAQMRQRASVAQKYISYLLVKQTLTRKCKKSLKKDTYL